MNTVAYIDIEHIYILAPLTAPYCCHTDNSMFVITTVYVISSEGFILTMLSTPWPQRHNLTMAHANSPRAHMLLDPLDITFSFGTSGQHICLGNGATSQVRD